MTETQNPSAPQLPENQEDLQVKTNINAGDGSTLSDTLSFSIPSQDNILKDPPPAPPRR